MGFVNEKKVLEQLQEKLTNTNRQVFKLRVRQRKYGLSETDRIEFRRLKILQFRYKQQVKGLKKRLGVE